MTTRLSHVGLAIMLTGVFALPACKKSDAPPDGAEKSPEVLAVQENLRQIGNAMHNGHHPSRGFPGGYYGPDGKTVGLSWRVALLPYIEQAALHKEFKLDEPWDSEHNKKLIEKMPKVYAPPSGGQPGMTYYRSFVGKGALIDLSDEAAKSGPGVLVHTAHYEGVKKGGILDGNSNTAMVAEAAEAVVWTKPDELEFKPDGPLPKLGGISQGGTCILMCDNSVYFLKRNDASPDLLKALITVNGDERIGLPGRD